MIISPINACPALARPVTGTGLFNILSESRTFLFYRPLFNQIAILRPLAQQLHIDRTLFLRIAEGDGRAFTELFNLCFEPLKWNALKLLKSEFWAEEIVQEVFTQLWRNRQQLAAVEAPVAYLYRMTANRSLDRIRRDALEVRMQYAVNKALHGDPDIFQENKYDLKFVERLISEAIGRLPDQGRRIFELQQKEGLSYQEIADRLGLSKNTVRNHMVKNLQVIRTYMRQHGEIPVLLFSLWYLF